MRAEPRALVRRLTPTATRMLEAAVARAQGSQCYEILVEHLLLQLLQGEVTDTALVLRHFQVDRSRLAARVERVIQELKTGKAGRPVFSEDLFQWFEDAWLLASLELGASRLRSGALFAQFVMRRQRYSGELFPELEALPPDLLKRELAQVLRPSAETVEAEPEPTGVHAPRPTAPGGHGREALSRFTVSFTGMARAGKVDSIFGRDREIAQLVDILSRRRKNNPLIVGEPGVGKTALVEGLALAIVEGEVPPVLWGVELLGLDLGLLQAGAGVRGEFESRLEAVISEVKASPKPIILFIDEAHTLIGAGGPAGGSDAANLLKPALARGELRTIAATTWSEYKKYFEKDAALERRFQPVKVEEPSEEDALLMLRGLRSTYEEAHGVEILEEALSAAVRLSHRYISGRQLPDKAVDLLDTAAARVKVEQSSRPKGEEAPGRAQVGAEVVARVVSGWTGVPVGKVRGDTLSAVLGLEDRLGERVRGQPAALRTVAETLRIAQAGLRDPEAPIGVLLFVGPSGVGKTETALALADSLYGGERFLTTLNMSEFQEKHSVSRLIGSPPGYVGYGEGGLLTEAVRQRPYSVILLDECEKADLEVMNLFYQVFDKGVLTDGEGRAVDFRNTVILLTSNLASEQVLRMYEGGASPSAEEVAAAIRPTLSRHFKPALLARMTVVPFAPIGPEVLQQIVRLELDVLASRMRAAHGVETHFAPELVDVLVRRCTSSETGARSVEHTLRDSLIPAISRELLQGMAGGALPQGLSVGLDSEGNWRIEPVTVPVPGTERS